MTTGKIMYRMEIIAQLWFSSIGFFLYQYETKTRAITRAITRGKKRGTDKPAEKMVNQ